MKDLTLGKLAVNTVAGKILPFGGGHHFPALTPGGWPPLAAKGRYKITAEIDCD